MGLIRKIVVGGNPKDAMAYFLGMRVGGSMSVSAIVYDEAYMVRYHKERYLVYVEQEDGEQVLWKSVTDCPCLCEYDLNF